jgi:hypothetical protein
MATVVSIVGAASFRAKSSVASKRKGRRRKEVEEDNYTVLGATSFRRGRAGLKSSDDDDSLVVEVGAVRASLELPTL